MIVVLDANVLIALERPQHEHHSRARAIVTTPATRLLAHDLTIGEYLVHPARMGRLDAGWLFLRSVGVERAAITEVAMAWPSRLATVRADTGLRMPDVVVLATALDIGGALATFERDLAKAAQRLGVPVVDGGKSG